MKVDPAIPTPPEFSPHSHTLFVFLGASNLARGYTALVAAAKHLMQPHPCEFLCAMGPGRAYCVSGGIWNVVYPPIQTSGILAAARKKGRHASRVVALITDIGNDIMYGVPFTRIVTTLSEILEELRALNAEISISCIPVDLEGDVGKRNFKILKRLYFPKSPVTFSEAVVAVDEVNRYIEGLSAQGIHVIRGLRDYRGMDRIHHSILKSSRVWSLMASEMFHVPDDKTQRLINWRTMRQSFISNMIRLVFTDMMRVREKDPGFF